MRWSQTGLSFVLAYVAIAAYMFHDAMTCIGWVCDLGAIFVFPPAGEIYWWPFSGQVPNPMRRWEFVIPAALTNMVIYYFLGNVVGAVLRKLSTRIGL